MKIKKNNTSLNVHIKQCVLLLDILIIKVFIFYLFSKASISTYTVHCRMKSMYRYYILDSVAKNVNLNIRLFHIQFFIHGVTRKEIMNGI